LRPPQLEGVGQTRDVRTLYRGARIYTGRATAATALLVEDTQIAWLGAGQRADLPAAERVIELDGALLTPAFVDAHVHATGTGLAITTLDLSGVTSLAAALDLVERYARATRGRPVLGSGWDETDWPEHRAPTAGELDRAGYGGLVYLSRVDAHSAVVSSALLASVPGAAGLAGFSRGGHLSRQAHDAVRSVAFSSLTSGQIRSAQQAARHRATEFGIACLHEMGGPVISSADDFGGLLELATTEPGPDVIGYWAELLGIDAARELGATGAGGDLFCDGSLGSHTAALHEPYTDQPADSGALSFDVADLAEHLVRCAEAGLQAGFHAIGDAAVDQVLDAADLATARLGRPAGLGQRIEHAEMVADPSRLAAAGFIASVQPAFDANWGGRHGMYAERLGSDRAQTLNRFAQLQAAGVALCFGSDAPVTPLAPWAAIRAACYPHDPAAAISPRAAFAAHTAGGWLAARRSGEGILDVGAPATFAIWDAADPRSTDADIDGSAAVELPDLRPGTRLPSCLRTVQRGLTIFEHGS
jgi:predicted amidohydrolase YtcJ